ncbi:hypothetical protein [Anaeroselena agilis]|uniref:Uncharacterized protein n=1 Tax=Anaeroselena agilis TaxID=3063788 RepID=A0ABU3NZJ6_9FIRM|nr:hypothetical protein [Selenomonadales bacterium 4137-cl]
MAHLVDRYFKQNRVAEKYMKHYEDQLELLTERIKDVEEAGPSSLRGDQCRNASAISDPTVRKTMAILDAEEDTEKVRRWLALIREVEAGLPEMYLIVIRIWRKHRWKRGSQGWMRQAETEFAAEMAKLHAKDEADTYRSKQTLEGYWDFIIQITVRAAVARGLL